MLLTLIEQAQLVYLLSRYPKKQVLEDRVDSAKLEDALDGMRAAAKGLSGALKDGHAMIPWEELAKRPDSPDLAWRCAKRIAPTVIRELVPLLEGQPEAAFFLRPEERKPRAKAGSGRPQPAATSRRGPARRGRAARRPGRAGRSRSSRPRA